MPLPRVLSVLAPCAVPAAAGAAASSGTPRSSTPATGVPPGAEAQA